MKEPLSGHMQELEEVGSILGEKQGMHVDVCYDKRQMQRLHVHVDSDWAGDLLGRKSTTGVICQERQTFAEIHVMFADACCIVKWRS